MPVTPFPVTVGNALTFFTVWHVAHACSVTAFPSKVRATFGAFTFFASASFAAKGIPRAEPRQRSDRVPQPPRRPAARALAALNAEVSSFHSSASPPLSGCWVS